MRLLVAIVLLATSAAAAQTPIHTARDNQWRQQIHQALNIPTRLPALNAKTWSTFSPTPGVLADRVTYSTADGMIVPAIVYRPDPATTHYTGKLPGLVIVNGHGSDKFGWYAFYSGILFAKAGAVVVTYDMIGEGERNARKASRENPSPHDKDVIPPAPLPHDDWGRRLAGLMQVDLAQAVSYLIAQPEVDPKRIATLGYSMGSFVAGIEGAWDLRVHAVLLSAGGTFDGPGEYFDSGKLPCQAPPYRALGILTSTGQPGQPIPFGTPPVTTLSDDPTPDRGAILFALNADRGPTFVMNGAADKVMNIPLHNAEWFAKLRQRTITLHGSDHNVFTTIFYPGIDHRPSWVTTDGVEWLNAQLHFAFWNTDAKILAQGTTHISNWITANNVDISKNYFRQDREGGLDAVGTNVPAIPRSSLMVLPEPDWLRLESQLTYASWAAKTLAAEQAAISATPNPSPTAVH
jgi:dienelactone hydrolase